MIKSDNKGKATIIFTHSTVTRVPQFLSPNRMPAHILKSAGALFCFSFAAKVCRPGGNQCGAETTIYNAYYFCADAICCFFKIIFNNINVVYINNITYKSNSPWFS